MPSIVGISCDPEQAKKEWESKVSFLQYWEIIAKYPQRESAEIHGKSYASIFNSCFVSADNDSPSDWYVYRFDYLKVRNKESQL